MRIIVLSIALLLAGCATEDAEEPTGPADTDGDGYPDDVELASGSDPLNATARPEVRKTLDLAFSETAQVVGHGVPSVQCPGSQVSTVDLTWTIKDDGANGTRVHATDLVFTVSGSTTINDVDIFVFGPGGNSLGSATTSAKEESVSAGGQQPMGDYTIRVQGCSGAGDVAVTGAGLLVWYEPAPLA